MRETFSLVLSGLDMQIRRVGDRLYLEFSDIEYEIIRISYTSTGGCRIHTDSKNVIYEVSDPEVARQLKHFESSL